MTNQLYDIEDVINVNGTELECTGVTYQETEEGERHSYGYTFRLKSELDAEREEARKNQEEAEEE